MITTGPRTGANPNDRRTLRGAAAHGRGDSGPPRAAGTPTNGRASDAAAGGRRPSAVARATRGTATTVRARPAARAASGRPAGSGAAKKAATTTRTRSAVANRRRSVLQPGETPRTRGERTRQRVADALIDLVAEGDPSPTAKSVAERAGVSVRLIFHHFEDMDALYRLAVQVQATRHWADVREVPADAPIDERVDRTIQQRGKLYETVGPVRQALVPVLSRNDEIADAVAQGELRLRGMLEATFAPELRAAGRSRKELLDALDAATSWEAWDRLRRRQRLPMATSRKVIARMMKSLLTGPGSSGRP